MILLSALLLAAQPVTRPKPSSRPRRPAAAVVTAAPDAEWLKGLWVADANKGEAMEGCADWQAIFFQADGRYLDGDATGRWSLDGNRLKRQQFVYAEGGGDEEADVGEAQVTRIVRVAQDKLREIGADGKPTLYVRCPMPETPVAR